MSTAIVNGVVVPVFNPTYFRTRPQFILFLQSDFFPAADALGRNGIAVGLPRFRDNILNFPFFHLPPIWEFMEGYAPGDHGRDNYQVIYNGHSVGISSFPTDWRAAINGFAVPRVVSVRHMQQAHANWWVWLQTLALAHIDNPGMTAEDVFNEALPLAPTRRTRYAQRPIFTPSPN